MNYASFPESDLFSSWYDDNQLGGWTNLPLVNTHCPPLWVPKIMQVKYGVSQRLYSRNILEHSLRNILRWIEMVIRSDRTLLPFAEIADGSRIAALFEPQHHSRSWDLRGAVPQFSCCSSDLPFCLLMISCALTSFVCSYWYCHNFLWSSVNSSGSQCSTDVVAMLAT